MTSLEHVDIPIYTTIDSLKEEYGAVPSINELPFETLMHIFEYLGLEDVKKAGALQICKTWRAACADYLWQPWCEGTEFLCGAAYKAHLTANGLTYHKILSSQTVQDARWLTCSPSHVTTIPKNTPNEPAQIFCNETHVYSLDHDGRVFGWDLTSGVQTAELGGHISAAKFSKTSQLAAFGRTDASLGIWDLSANKYVFEMEGSTCRALSDNHALCVRNSNTQVLQVYDMQTMQPTHSYNTLSHFCEISGDTILTYSPTSAKMMVWDVRSPREVGFAMIFRSSIENMLFDGNKMVARTLSAHLGMIDIRNLNNIIHLAAFCLDADMAMHGHKLLYRKSTIGPRLIHYMLRDLRFTDLYLENVFHTESVDIFEGGSIPYAEVGNRPKVAMNSNTVVAANAENILICKF